LDGHEGAPGYRYVPVVETLEVNHSTPSLGPDGSLPAVKDAHKGVDKFTDNFADAGLDASKEARTARIRAPQVLGSTRHLVLVLEELHGINSEGGGEVLYGL
jgi:hypothetical protein